ncbi:unnamed protein product [Closterium sp. NIES-54]
MYSHLLVSYLPRSIPPLTPSPAPPCLTCDEGRHRAAPHSSSFPPMTAPLQTLHMDVWGPACVSGQDCERYFFLVVDDYTRYTTVFPLHSKGKVPDVFITWIHAVRLQLREQFRHDLPVLRLHNDRGGEFSSDFLRDFCHGEGILQLFTLPASPQQNGIAEHRIGLVIEVARSAMIHAGAPHFLWPFAVRYDAHQLNLWPHVSLPATSRTLRWTGEVGDASLFRVWGSRDFVCDTSADKLSALAILCVFLGFPPDAPGWQFYHPTSRRVFPSHDVTFDESVPFYRPFPYCSAPPPSPPLFLATGPHPVDPLPPQGRAPSCVSQVDPLCWCNPTVCIRLVVRMRACVSYCDYNTLPSTVPIEEVVGTGTAARGAASWGAASGGAKPGGAESEGAGFGGAEPGGAEPGGAEPVGVEPGGAESLGAESGGAEPPGIASSGGPTGASPRLSPRPEPLPLQQLHEWFAQRIRLQSGAAGATDSAAGDTGAGGAGVTTGAGGTGSAAATNPGGARTRCTGAAGTGGVGGARAGAPTEPGVARAGDVGAGGTRAGGAGAGGAGAGGAGVVDPAAGGAGAEGAVSGCANAGGTVRPRAYFVPLLQQVLGVPSSTGHTPPLLCPPPDQLQPLLQPASPLSAPSPYTERIGGLTERCEPASCPASPVRTGRRVPRPRPPPLPGTHPMALRPSSDPQCVPLPPPPESSLPTVPDPESDRAHYAIALAAESKSDCTSSVPGECALGTDVLEDKQEDFECLAATVPRFASMLLAPEGDSDAPDIKNPRSYVEAITGPYSSQWQAAMDIEMASWKSTGTYVNAVPPSRANIVDGMWIFRVKRPPGSPCEDLGSIRRAWGSCLEDGVQLSSLVTQMLLGSSCEAEIYAGAIAAQELRWLTYLLTDLGEQPCSPPVLYIDNKAMIALCQEHKVEHRTTHIALRYFLAQELQQRGQLRLAYMATTANIADIFTKALPPVPVTPVLSLSAYRARLSYALVPAPPAVVSPLLTRPISSRPVAPAVPSHPVAPAVPSRRPCRRVAPTVPSRPVALAVPLHRPLLSRRVAPVPSVPPRRAVRPGFGSSSIHLYASTMATPILRFDAEGRSLEFSVWLLRARRLRESQVQAHETLWAHASGDLAEPADPAPLAADPTPINSDRYARERADVSAWKSHDAAACITLSNLLPESEESHFTQRNADLITHLRSLDSSYRAACTDAQLSLLPPPMATTIYFIATSLPDRLASVRDALLLKHPSELTIEVLELALRDVESNLHSVASASSDVPPPLFHRCTVPQLPTSTASLATAATDVTAGAVMTSSQSQGRIGRRGGHGAGGGGRDDVASGGSGSAEAGGAPHAAVNDTPATAAAAAAPPIAAATAAAAAAAGFGAGVRTASAAARCHPPSLHLSRSDRCPPRPALWPQPPIGHVRLGGYGRTDPLLNKPFYPNGLVVGILTWRVRLGGYGRTDPLLNKPFYPNGLVVGILTQYFAQLTDMVRLADSIDGPAPNWLPLVQTYGPTLWGMSASHLVDLLGTPHAMYAVVDSSASDSIYSSVVSLGASLCKVPVASVGTCVDTSPGAAPEDASIPVTARYNTMLPCPNVPSGSLTGFHVPSFSRNLVGMRPLVPVSHQVAASPQVAVSGQVLVSGLVAESCSCQLLARPTVLWHHRMGQPSISYMRVMSSQCLVLGLPRVLPSLPPSLTPPCGPCVEGRLRATPHSSSLRPSTEPFETLHLDVWGPASRPGPQRESFFLVVIDDYSRYTTVIPLAKKVRHDYGESLYNGS